LLEAAIAKLPASYRAVLVMRDVEELSTAEAAESLGISEENVKVRLHRARGMLRETLYQSVGATSTHAFQFHAVRCDRVVANVFKRIG
jgi:RNA polymerase sigma-70 factor (ECF subfamily)